MEFLPTIHVIIPVYKSEKYVAQTLDSVLAQPYPNIQIVCVDDGSPDNSFFVLRDYENRHSNVHVIRQENGGVSSARNTGIEYVMDHCADGDYLIFLDADDLWTRNAVTPEFVRENFDSDCVACTEVCCTNDLSRTSAPNIMEAKRLPGGAGSVWCHADAPMGAIFYLCGMIRKYRIRFTRGLAYAEDKQFKYACLFLAETINLTGLVLYCYRANPLSAMHSRKHGITFMPPIVRGYLQLREFVRPYEDGSRGEAVFCDVLACVHALEMCVEHFAHFHSARALRKFLDANPDLHEVILKADPKDLSEEHRQMRHRYLHAPMQFRLGCLAEGAG